MKPNDATLRQIEAADPTQNTWLSANAGSGKTRVLTDRVARLLLSAVSPQNILCLTYTKAAASEMQNRLFARLGDWAMKPDEELRRELLELGEVNVDDLALARRLFAGAIETPGGLKIQTIHSFCASILRRFPLEAGVAPQFQEMDERSAALLQAEVLDEMAAGPDRRLVEGVATFFSDNDFTSLLQEITSRREAFTSDISENEVWDWLGLERGFNETSLENLAFGPDDGLLLHDLSGALASGSKTEVKVAPRLAALARSGLTWLALPELEKILLTGSGAKEPFSAKIGSFPTKAMREGPIAHLVPRLEELMQRVEQSRPKRLALDTARKTLALHRFARVFLKEYEHRKQARGWLDFDDLISIAGRLLNDPGLAAWVLYRLDGGIDHILVDEAQDTSPAQWKVIESLAREFTTGESARSERERTLFAVGDVKQSIYSFQGADPAEFSRMFEAFKGAFKQIGRDVKGMQLEYSFRSSRAILDVVDFSLDTVPGLGDKIKHVAFQNERPGRVDLWPVIERSEKPEKGSWADPVDMLAPEDATVVLADRVADAISEMLKSGSIPGKNGDLRPVRPGDVIVLVRRRSDLFHEVIRACKARSLPIAGADVLRIGGELAVKDIAAVLSFLATPEDDLSLAAALRSPLLGLDEDGLFRLAHGRGRQFLWNALRTQAESYPDIVAILNDLRREADYLRPYDLIDRILTRHDGRRRLIARLGPEAEDGIDALLAQALTYERMEVPSLTGFLSWLAAEEVKVKRQLDDASDQIRVMTVHGAKGLEAPVVFLPDTTVPKNRERRKTVSVDGQVLWRASRDSAPAIMAEALDGSGQSEWEENMRLLYVAMTRAESWLVVAGAGDVGKEGEAASWYRIVEAGMHRAGATDYRFVDGYGLRFETGQWEMARAESHSESKPGELSLPHWAREHASIPLKTPGPLIPSDLGEAKAIGSTVDDAAALESALRHGRQIHRLFEFLPAYDPASWPKIAADLLAFGEDAASPAEAAALLEEVRGVLESPSLAHLFGPETLAEIEVSAPVEFAGASRIHGVIDRLVIEPDRVLVVDFKTNRDVPDKAEDVPEGILRQMGAYETALALVYPDRRIETAILWTRPANLMPLHPGQALRAFGRLDGTQGAT